MSMVVAAEIDGEPGACLGTCPSRALTEAMGGRLMLRSGGGGTTAVVTSPASRPAARS